jgi:hydrogenase maturation protease
MTNNYVEGRGEISSIGSGWIFVEKPYHPILEAEKPGGTGEKMSAVATPAKPLVLGIGKLLMGDEGVGIAAIRHLEEKGFAEHAELVDGGAGGFHLPDLIRDRRHIILIDAADDGKPAGTVSLIQPRYAGDFPPTLTAHELGLKDLLESAARSGDLPEVDLITISVGGPRSLTMDLSPAVAEALPLVKNLVVNCLFV